MGGILLGPLILAVTFPSHVLPSIVTYLLYHVIFPTGAFDAHTWETQLFLYLAQSVAMKHFK